MRLKNPKKKGGHNERRMRDWLEARGYSVTKAGGSLGCWDLIGHSKRDAVFDATMILVQVKSIRGPSPEERRLMTIYIRTHRAGMYLIARWKHRAREPSLLRWNHHAEEFEPWEADNGR
jgi:hypothetical protein